MDFHLAFTPRPFQTKINHRHKLFLAGSCFTEQVGAKLAYHKFQTLENPNGILFNPVSIASSVQSYIRNKQFTPEDLFFYNELWGSWEHHTRFSGISQAQTLQGINTSLHRAHLFLQETDWLLITLGSAFVYELETGKVVANCHKVPTDKFNKRLLTVEEVQQVLTEMKEELLAFNPHAKIIYTISPVRNLRDGFVENNRSKATLINAVHGLLDKDQTQFYFPAYELVIDDLRDYRFYAEDMVHPNYAATNYVWEKFIAACMDESSALLMKEIAAINAARHHKPFNPLSAQHQKFMETNLQKAARLQEEYPYMDLGPEIAYFGDKLPKKSP
jgi:hypothetical protein